MGHNSNIILVSSYIFDSQRILNVWYNMPVTNKLYTDSYYVKYESEISTVMSIAGMARGLLTFTTRPIVPL